MGDFLDNIFLRAAFGGAIEIPETTSSCSPSTSASGAATFSDAPQLVSNRRCLLLTDLFDDKNRD